jgi:hypothetical protein
LHDEAAQRLLCQTLGIITVTSMDIWTTCIFWSIALVASALYGWKAVEIHSPPKKTPIAKTDGSQSTTDAEVREETDFPSSWWWHQRWLNFLGALVGWIALWFLARKFAPCLFAECTVAPSAWDVAGAFLAFVGITGFLPGTIVSGLSSFSGLSAKLTELLASWITKAK